MESSHNIGDIVLIVEDGYAYGRLGRITAPIDVANESKFRLTYRVPVMFPGFAAPRWFEYADCRLASDTQHRQYFKEMLKHGK